MKKGIIFSMVALAALSLSSTSCIKIYVSGSDSEESSESSVVASSAEASVEAAEDQTTENQTSASYYTKGNTVYGTEYDWLSERYVTYDDISSLEPGQIRVLKNSIYARHGRLFKDSRLQDYFNSCSWYNGYRKDVSQSEFNHYETKNVAFLKQYER